MGRQLYGGPGRLARRIEDAVDAGRVRNWADIAKQASFKKAVMSRYKTGNDLSVVEEENSTARLLEALPWLDGEPEEDSGVADQQHVAAGAEAATPGGGAAREEVVEEEVVEEDADPVVLVARSLLKRCRSAVDAGLAWGYAKQRTT